jgi:hypothetical protein
MLPPPSAAAAAAAVFMQMVWATPATPPTPRQRRVAHFCSPSTHSLPACCIDAAAAEGVGDPSDPAYSKAAQGCPHPYGSTHTGGSPVEFGGGPGQRQVSDAVAGGPIKGGSKTTFTTMG